MEAGSLLIMVICLVLVVIILTVVITVCVIKRRQKLNMTTTSTSGSTEGAPELTENLMRQHKHCSKPILPTAANAKELATAEPLSPTIPSTTKLTLPTAVGK